MTEYVIAAGRHGRDEISGEQTLLSRNCREEFARTLEPSLTKNSLVLVEGRNQEDLIETDHPKYNVLCKQLSDTLIERGVTFGTFDSRQSPIITERFEAQKVRRGWTSFCAEVIHFEPKDEPKNLGELLDQCKSPTENPTLRRQPEQSEVELAKLMLRENNGFDQGYVEAMNLHASFHDQCVVIVGGAHAISIALKTGFPLIALDHEQPLSLYRYGYLLAYIWPDILSKL